MIKRLLFIALFAGAAVSGLQAMWSWGQPRKSPFLDSTQQHGPGVLEADLAKVILDKVQNIRDTEDGEFNEFLLDLKAHLKKGWIIDSEVACIPTDSFGKVSIDTAISYINYILNKLPSEKKKTRGRAAFAVVKETLDAQKEERKRLAEKEAKKNFLNPQWNNAKGALENNLLNATYLAIDELKENDEAGWQAFKQKLKTHLESRWIIDTKMECVAVAPYTWKASVDYYLTFDTRSGKRERNFVGMFFNDTKQRRAREACDMIQQVCDTQRREARERKFRFLDPDGYHQPGELEKNLINVIVIALNELEDSDKADWDAFIKRLEAHLASGWIIDTEKEVTVTQHGYGYIERLSYYLEDHGRGLPYLVEYFHTTTKRARALQACQLIINKTTTQKRAAAKLKSDAELDKKEKAIQAAREREQKEAKYETERLARRKAKGLPLEEEETFVPRTESWNVPLIGTLRRTWLQIAGLTLIGGVTLFFVIKSMMLDVKKDRQKVK